MKRRIFAVLLALMLSLLMVSAVSAEKFTWTNPTTYSDGSAISITDQSALQTNIKVKSAAETDYITLATVKYGGKSFTGAFPAAYVPGTEMSVQFSWTLRDLTSEAVTTTYTLPTIPPSPGTDITITR